MRKKSRDRHITLVLIRDSTSPLIHLRLPRSLVHAAAIVTAVAVITAAISSTSWYQVRRANAGLQQSLQQKDRAIEGQSDAIRQLADQAARTQSSLQELETMRQRLDDLLAGAASGADTGLPVGGDSPPGRVPAAPGSGQVTPGAGGSHDGAALLQAIRDTALPTTDRLIRSTSELMTQQISRAEQLNQALSQYQQMLAARLEYLSHTPRGLPIRTSYWISSPYGWRESPFGRGQNFHGGVDLAVDYGTPVYASADGVVEVAGYYDDMYGVVVIIDHGHGFKTLYAHNQPDLEVKPKQQVKQSDLLSHVGLSGETTGPHLHYEVRLNGAPVNPVPYLK